MKEHSLELIPGGRTAGDLAPNYSGAEGDLALIQLWLSTKSSKHTKAAYGADAGHFLGFLQDRGLDLRRATVADLTAWMESLSGAVTSRARRVAAVKSLLMFAHRTGYTLFNVGAVVKAPTVPNNLAERILSEEQVKALILACRGTTAVLVRFLYASGARISEALPLTWEKIHPAPGGKAFVTLFGKGSKTRHIALPEAAAKVLFAMKKAKGAGPHDLVFPSRRGGELTRSAVAAAIRRAARRAGIEENVSAHWLRHACASHALDRGAPVHVVQATLGHSSLATTGKYVHIRPTDGAGLHLKMEGL